MRRGMSSTLRPSPVRQEESPEHAGEVANEVLDGLTTVPTANRPDVARALAAREAELCLGNGDFGEDDPMGRFDDDVPTLRRLRP
jgi:hypothetical protein